MTDMRARAIEILAQQYDEQGLSDLADGLRQGRVDETRQMGVRVETCLAAITRALQGGGSAGVGAPLQDIAAERRRQIEGEGWSLEHDDGHGDGELAKAAGCYALHAGGRRDFVHAPGRLGQVTQPRGWPWCATWWKPADPRRDLVRAGALIVAEIERIDRAAPPYKEPERG